MAYCIAAIPTTWSYSEANLFRCDFRIALQPEFNWHSASCSPSCDSWAFC